MGVVARKALPLLEGAVFSFRHALCLLQEVDVARIAQVGAGGFEDVHCIGSVGVVAAGAESLEHGIVGV